ncbi:hypothetical protein B0H16DRAFT_775801 [Mycena metata]|uniref:Uncharacterized protein n=1 Tax=Mycena metata TaxID=1033252 RepID=A0AAD7IZX5_9AGAR|nr:hypothetical protein B0H16DRAFT_775801 [Mycena metata]
MRARIHMYYLRLRPDYDLGRWDAGATSSHPCTHVAAASRWIPRSQFAHATRTVTLRVSAFPLNRKPSTHLNLGVESTSISRAPSLDLCGTFQVAAPYVPLRLYLLTSLRCVDLNSGPRRSRPPQVSALLQCFLFLAPSPVRCVVCLRARSEDSTRPLHIRACAPYPHVHRFTSSSTSAPLSPLTVSHTHSCLPPPYSSHPPCGTVLPHVSLPSFYLSRQCHLPIPIRVRVMCGSGGILTCDRGHHPEGVVGLYTHRWLVRGEYIVGLLAPRFFNNVTPL